MEDKTEKIITRILIGIAILGMILFIYKLSTPKEEKIYECSSCGKTFTNLDDTSSIAYTSMCERCYSNFEYTQKALEGFKKYEENYGDY